MKTSDLDFLRSPCCFDKLELESNETSHHKNNKLLVCVNCQKSYPIVNSIPWLFIEENILENDRKFTQQADEYSANYEKMLKLMGLFVMMWEPRQRKKFLQGLDIAKGSKILDICTGPGNNLKELHKQIGKEGLLVAIDLSEKMVEKCQKKHATLPVSIHRGNALALPYKDNFFDVVITSGGLNTFGDKKKGITEMMRVGKKGALIVIVDEGMKPTKRETWIGKRLIKMNSLYKTKPPLKLLPDEVDPKIGYIYRDTFYTLQFENP